MEKRSFLNVPEEASTKILEKEPYFVEKTYRGLYQKGNPQPSDFTPSFMDMKQQELREKRKQCGVTAAFVVKQHNSTNIKEYGVSLFCTIEDVKRVLWKNESYRKDYPALAEGPTKDTRGYAVKDSSAHISYYLEDYIAKNPFQDFVTIEEANDDE